MDRAPNTSKAANIAWQTLHVDKGARAALKNQRPICVWFTGLPGSGKTTVASLVESMLRSKGCHTYVLDGDNLRHGLNRDLGFSKADRTENIRRAAEVAKLMVDAGLVVLAAFVSPYREQRQMARSMFQEREFVEVFVDTPVRVCEERDPKGLYSKARAGHLLEFTGVDSPYEAPADAELHLNTSQLRPAESATIVCEYLRPMIWLDH